MFQSWRLQIRQAEEAARLDRLDEAKQILREGELDQYRPGREVAKQVCDRLIERADQHLAGGDTTAGWRDIDDAEALGGENERLIAVRRALTAKAIDEATAMLEADDCSAALQVLDRLSQRVSGEKVRTLSLVAKRLQSASDLCQAGKFHEANQLLDSVSALRPDLTVVSKRRAACRQSIRESRKLLDSLETALHKNNWDTAALYADALLDIAPEHRFALQVLQRVRSQEHREADRRHTLSETRPATRELLEEQNGDSGIYFEDSGIYFPGPEELAAYHQKTPRRETIVGHKNMNDERFLLWVDAVGGYLVLLGQEVVLGQSVPGATVDVPILADLARKHAKIRRLGESYVIEPIGEVRVTSRLVTEDTLLSHGDEIQLGSSVRLRFQQPHPLSSTARLDFIGRQRIQPAADAVLLMGETCVMGPNRRNHIVCRDWSEDVVLHRKGGSSETLYCRASDSFEIDGKVCQGRGLVTRDSRICGEDFSLSLETV